MKLYIIITILTVGVGALSDQVAWETFKFQYSKNYEVSENVRRFEIFQKNLRIIEHHNAKYNRGEVSYFLITTQFADWTKQEFQTILTPQITATPTNIQPSKVFVKSNITVPDAVDWRDQNAVLEVKNQSNCVAGWAFSTTGSIEGQMALLKNQRISMSEQELVDCSTWTFGCFGGSMRYAFFYVQDNGLSSEEQYSFTAVEDTCKATDVEDKVLDPIAGYATVEQSEGSLLEAVATVGPISIAICADEDYGWQLYGGGIYDDPRCKDDLNHGILLIGYGSENNTDYWILKNSWGEQWGENGYIRLARGKNRCGIRIDSSYPLLTLN